MGDKYMTILNFTTEQYRDKILEEITKKQQKDIGTSSLIVEYTIYSLHIVRKNILSYGM